MKTTFSTTVFKDDKFDATGLVVPPEAIAALESGKKPKVIIFLNGYTYRSTVAVMGGVYMLPLAREHRLAAGVNAGDTVDVTLELDIEPRTVTIPPDLAAALAEIPGAAAAFDTLAYSIRKEHIRQVESAKAQETRTRRISNIVTKLSGS
ncbi:MAG: DUF1905 domain-containing protein [Anaerolineaceae bacterium]|nr:DUF1905 domain-containing protein [Anaerolineaceae bacterium]